ncbi:hypothetical protein AVEN_111871-1 [Araneus ventricosus]|uniref:Uncharacterized protein n=1 Tax=Araneus ventricosus TaxID=182803 RepID=A0A4Y2BX44_ARAVE|nr:hypothetical protein AVEN_111871-1 [Araneus ventricosus]
MGLSFRFSKDSTFPKPHSFLVGESAYQSIMLLFASSQPPTIWHHPANNNSQYGSAAYPTIQRQEGRSIICSTFSKEKPIFSVRIPNNCFFFPSIVFLVESNAIIPFPQSWTTFLQTATSVTEHPLPPSMREFKTNQTSTVHPASSSLHPFLWRWKASFHQFNVQLRLLFSPSSPNEPRTALVVLSGLSSKIHHQLTPLQNRTY